MPSQRQRHSAVAGSSHGSQTPCSASCLMFRQAVLQSQPQLWSVLHRSWSWRVPERRRRQRRGAWQPSWRACVLRGQQTHPGYVAHTSHLARGLGPGCLLAHVSKQATVMYLSCRAYAGQGQQRHADALQLYFLHHPSAHLCALCSGLAIVCLGKIMVCKKDSQVSVQPQGNGHGMSGLYESSQPGSCAGVRPFL